MCIPIVMINYKIDHVLSIMSIKLHTLNVILRSRLVVVLNVSV